MRPAPPSALSRGLAAARANLWPGVALSAFAVAVLLGYELWPPLRAALGRLAAWRAGQPPAVALGFAAASTTLAGAAFPALAGALRPGGRRESARGLLWLLGFWCVVGVQVDLLYRGLDALVGPGRDPLSVACKIALDMGVYCPALAIPQTVLAYGLKDAGFSWARYRESRGIQGAGGIGAWYRREVVPVLVSNWAVWVPAVCVIYLLPLPLQLPVQNLVLVFWCLMLTLLAGERPGAATAAPA